MKKRKIPRIGMRIIKSALAVFLCFLVFLVRGDQGTVLNAMLAVLWCMQPYIKNSYENALQRILGTAIGAIFGLLIILIPMERDIYYYALCSLTIVFVLYTTVLLKKKNASFFSCAVFLTVVINNIAGIDPYIYTFNRFIDTIIGIVIGVGVNSIHMPRKKVKNVLFVSGLDETLLSHDNHVLPYSEIELNKMLDAGLKFTISSMRTPAALIEPLSNIHLNLPIIAMNGAVLYDIESNSYTKVFYIKESISKEVINRLEMYNYSYFTNVLIEDALLIFYNHFSNEVHETIYKTLKKSPYRNYIQTNEPFDKNVIYFMMIDKLEVIQDIYNLLESMQDDLVMITYQSSDYPGYYYLKIYDKAVSKTAMINELMKITDTQKCMTFGTVEGQYDILIRDNEHDEVVRKIKKMYRPMFYRRKQF